MIVATRQAAAVVERCMQSLFGQRFEDWELLVSDGGSTDGTVDVLRKYESRIAWWCSQADSGIYDAWNRALAHAAGEYVCFMGADDAWADERALERLFEAIGFEHYDLVTSRGLTFDPATGRRFPFGSPWDYHRLGRRMVVCHPGMLHHRSLFARFGEFDDSFRIAGDLEFLLRLPEDLKTLHLDSTTVLVEGAGLSRRNVLARLREQRIVLSRCERYGHFRAYLAWAGKLWRMPVARFLGIPH